MEGIIITMHACKPAVVDSSSVSHSFPCRHSAVTSVHEAIVGGFLSVFWHVIF